jgi:hypothetical protein
MGDVNMSDLSKKFKVGFDDRFHVCPLYDANGGAIYDLAKAIECAKRKFPGKPCEVFNDEVSYKITYPPFLKIT